MFEFDAGKLVIIGIVALIVIGPKELPRVMRQVGQAVAKIRRLGAEFQAQFMDAMREADLAEIKAEAAKISEAVRLDMSTDPLASIGTELTESLERPETRPEADASLAPHAEPRVEALHESPETALEAVELDETKAEPLPAAPVAEMAQPQPPERALEPEPLRSRA